MTLTHERGNGAAPAPSLQLLSGERRHIDREERARYEAYLAASLGSLGIDLQTPGTADTPRRLLQPLIDATERYDADPQRVTAYPTECYGGASCELAQSVEGPIPFFPLC